MNPNGRAILKGCQYRAALDDVCEDYPFTLATGRNHLHFHTRTKTGRSKRLRHADHDPYVQIHEEDAKKLDIKVGCNFCTLSRHPLIRYHTQDGDFVVVETRNGKAELPAKLGKIEPGQVFIPFHWGAHNQGGHDHMDGRAVAANELTQPAWDFISKQPVFKVRCSRRPFKLVRANLQVDPDCRGEAHQGDQRQARSTLWPGCRYQVAGETCV